MPYEQKPNTGALFKNDRRETENHPNAKGKALIDGTWYWISAWTNTAKSGEKEGQKYQNLNFQLMEDQPDNVSPTPVVDDLDDEVPF